MMVGITSLQARRILAVLCGLLPATPAQAEQLLFLCSVDNRKPFDLIVDLDSRRATRSDRAAEYDVIKISARAVWLLADDPGTTASVSVELVQRVVAVNRDTRGGTWLRTVIRQTGSVSDREAGRCWEQP